MSDTTDTTTGAESVPEDRVSDATPAEGAIPDPTPTEGDEPQGDNTEDTAETFPRDVVERLRQENGRYRQRAQRADDLAHRLHLELVRATGRLADPTDLAFDEGHLDDPDALAAAVDDLLDRKPHLASRRPSGDIGQGVRGPAAAGFSLLDALKART